MAKISEKDVLDIMDIFTKVPVMLLKGAIKSNMNVVKTFQDQVESYKNDLNPEEMDKIKYLTEMPVSEIQEILNNVYKRTGKEQLRVLADPDSKDFISLNLNELRKILFN